jgi:hypothetical protein
MAPFTYDVIICGAHYSYFNVWRTLTIISLVIGAPMVFGGIIYFFVGDTGDSSVDATLKSDISRIRQIQDWYFFFPRDKK